GCSGPTATEQIAACACRIWAGGLFRHVNQAGKARCGALLPGWALPDMAIDALHPSRKHLSPAVRAFLDFLVERFARLPW
ncbi:MAG: LysR family transcriptional regulator, partial [Polaromonas sp.]|nr:LysR family transcriptional regulator [Polaromonas sp.]